MDEDKKEKRIAFLANRWINVRRISELDLMDVFEAQSRKPPEDIYLKDVIISAYTIRQADEFSLLEDQIVFLSKARDSYKSIYWYIVKQIEGEEDTILMGLAIGSEKWIQIYQLLVKERNILEGYINEIEEILKQKIKQSLIARTDNHDQELKSPNQTPLNISKEELKEIFNQLSLLDNAFIDRASRNNFDQIVNDNFKDFEQLCGEHKVNWLGPITSFRYFFELAQTIPIWIINKGYYAKFFASHCTHKGKILTRDQVKNCARQKPPKTKKDKIDRILTQLINKYSEKYTPH